MAKNDHQGSFTDSEWQLLRVLKCLDTREHLVLVGAIYAMPVALGYYPRVFANTFFIGRPDRERDIRLDILSSAYKWTPVNDGEGETHRDGWIVLSLRMTAVATLFARGFFPEPGEDCYEGTFTD